MCLDEQIALRMAQERVAEAARAADGAGPPGPDPGAARPLDGGSAVLRAAQRTPMAEANNQNQQRRTEQWFRRRTL